MKIEYTPDPLYDKKSSLVIIADNVDEYQELTDMLYESDGGAFDNYRGDRANLSITFIIAMEEKFDKKDPAAQGDGENGKEG